MAAQAHFEAGIAAHKLGDLVRAEALYRDALKDAAAPAEALYLLGTVLSQRGRSDEALPLLRQAHGALPGHVPTMVNLASALTTQGHTEEALAFYDKALALNPRHAMAWNARGGLQRLRGELAQSLESFEHALRLDPSNRDFLFQCSQALALLDRFSEALAATNEIVRLNPNWAVGYAAKGAIQHQMARYDDALASHEQALTIDPTFVAALDGRGMAMRALHRYEEALAAHDQALAINPNFADAINHRGLALMGLGRLDEAISALDAGIARDPLAHDQIFNRSLALLLKGDFERGWDDYEARWHTPAFKTQKPGLKAPFWNGDPLNGRTLLVFAEQGIGDIIQFSRYLLWAEQQGGVVRCRVPQSLLWMLETVSSTVIFESHRAPLIEPDLQIALLSLPRLAKTRPHSIPAPGAYLRIPVEPHPIKSSADSVLSVGLCWSGSQDITVALDRFVSLDTLAPLASVAGVEFVSLKKPADNQAVHQQLEALGIATLGPDADSGPNAFSDTAAAIAKLDLVITVDTSIAHLAGAMGKPVWLLLKKVPDWRWLMDRDDTPWYPTARLFRQTEQGQWTTVIETVKTELERLVSRRLA